MKILSLIVPSYNSEKFLDKCILSFCDESVLNALDIIIVDDGSRDATADVARKYCQMYPDSIRLISQENKGHGGALNTGFSAAKGKYLKPIDADDWIESRNLPALIDALRNCDSDVLLTHYHVIDISNGSISEMKSCPEKYGRAMTIDELMSQWGSFFRVTTFHGIAYNRQFYQKHNNALTEHVFYEDNEYSTIPFCYAKTIMPLDLFIYEYRVGDVTQSIAVDNQVKRLDHIQAVIERMLQVYCQLPEGAGRQYVAAKTQAVGMMYLTTALLAHPDKKTGRQLAQDRMAAFKNTAPAIYDMLTMKYRVYKLLSALHVSKRAWDRFLNSRIYNRLRSR